MKDFRLKALAALLALSAIGCAPQGPASYTLTTTDPVEAVESDKFVAGLQARSGEIRGNVNLELSTRWAGRRSLPLIPHVDSVAALLPDGKILICGGLELTPSYTPMVMPVQSFDPRTRQTLTLPPMPGHRRYHSVVPLRDGGVLVGGGWPEGSDLFRWMPAKNTWEVIEDPVNGRKDLRLLAMTDGRIGLWWPGSRLGAAHFQVWDPSTGEFRNTGWGASSKERFAVFPTEAGGALVVSLRNGSAHFWSADTSQWLAKKPAMELKGFPTVPRGTRLEVLYQPYYTENNQILLVSETRAAPALLWDVAREKIRRVEPPPAAPIDGKMLPLGDGRYLFVWAGDSQFPDASLAVLAVFDLKSRRWAAVSNAAALRYSGQYFFLGDGRLAVSGGAFTFGVKFPFLHPRTATLQADPPQ